jgi:hypothetical protein
MMGKSISLRGPAAGAFVRALQGAAPLDDNERALRVAAAVHMYMKLNTKDGTEKAVDIIKKVAKDGL